jgi:putative membrane protein
MLFRSSSSDICLSTDTSMFPALVALSLHPDHAHGQDAAGGAAALFASRSAWDLVVLAGLLAIACVYAVAVYRLWHRAGTGRGVRWWEAGAFALGWVALALALVSPLDALSDVLFAAHMTQHELIMLVAAPLIVLGRPLLVYVWLAPERVRRRIRSAQHPALLGAWYGVTAPVTVLLLHGVVVWIWHIPVLFEAALHSEAIHAFQHLTFFWTAALFWWALVHGRYGQLGYGVAVIFVFVTAVHTSILGALLTFAPTVWYPTYAERAPAAGATALEDQQLAGLLMWVPSGALFMLLGLALFAAWLGAAERRAALTRGGTRPVLTP